MSATGSFPSERASGPIGPRWEEGRVVAERYELIREIGLGGSGIVFEAFDRLVRAQIAVKMLRPDRVTEASMTRLRREVRVARSVDSTRIVRVFDIGHEGDTDFVTMELVEGESLRRRLERGMAPGEAVRVATQIAEGLDALHRAGIVHRDVKPGNVLLTREGDAKLCDFGLSLRFERDETRATETEAFVGTAEYLAPEQGLGRDVDARADLYALGVVVFEMLAGATPWHADSSLGVVLARFQGPVPDVRKAAPATPPWLGAVVSRLLERRREDRYASARALLQDLRRETAGWRTRLRVRRRSAAAAAAVAALLLGAAVAGEGISGHRFDHLTSAGGRGIAAVDGRGRTLWSRTDVAFPERAVLARAGPGGAPVVVALGSSPDPLDQAAQHTLRILDLAGGRVLRRVDLPRGSFPGVSSAYSANWITTADLLGDGVDDLFVSFDHTSGPMSYVVRWNPRTDDARLVFSATGYHKFAFATDVDGDGRKELVFYGINNAFGWYNAVAVTRLADARTGRELADEGAGSPDMTNSEATYVDYVLTPRGIWEQHEQSFALAPDRRTLSITYRDGGRFRVDLGGCGLSVAKSPAGCAPIREARRRAWTDLRLAEQLASTGRRPEALQSLAKALQEAHAAEDERLAEVVRLRLGLTRIASGGFAEAEPDLDALCKSSESGSELSEMVARAAHLAGELEGAVRWYARSLSTTGETGHFLSSVWSIDGGVMALGELGRWSDALAFAERFVGVHPNWRIEHEGWWRWYVDWRAGRPAPADLPEPAVTDLRRYWWLEWRLQKGDDPATLLSDIAAELQRVSGSPGLLLSLRGAVLEKLGREAEALETARRAFQEVRDARSRSIPARAHFGLVAGRYARLLESAGRKGEAVAVRNEARAGGA